MGLWRGVAGYATKLPSAAAEALGVSLEVRRSANAVYFWAPEAPRRGRTRKESSV